ncbi:unnamed protein product, partial [Scytosiphon promiscuus]
VQDSCGVEGSNVAEVCKAFASKGIGESGIRCSHQGCGITPSYHASGMEVPLFGEEHGSEDMADVVGRRCSRCAELPSLSWKGKKVLEFCKVYTAQDTVDIVN